MRLLLLSLLFAAILPFRAEDAPKNANELIATLGAQTDRWDAISNRGPESPIYIRMRRIPKGYNVRAEDEKTLLAGMKNENLDVDTRLCIAGFLLDLNDADARAIVEKTLDDPKRSDLGVEVINY